MNYEQRSAGRMVKGEIYLPDGLPYMGDRGLLPTKQGVELCKKWIQENLQHAPRFDYQVTSYKYKHFVEMACKHYIANQEFIVAMWELGFDMKPEDKSKVNWCFKARLYASVANKDH